MKFIRCPHCACRKFLMEHAGGIICAKCTRSVGAWKTMLGPKSPIMVELSDGKRYKEIDGNMTLDEP